LMIDYQELYDAVLDGEEDDALEQTQILLDQGLEPMTIINDGLIAAMAEVGRLFKEEELFLPEVMMAAEAVAAAIERLQPLLSGEMDSRGIVVIGTVKGDIHDIGKNLVALMMSSNGFVVQDLGTDVAAEDFVAAAEEHNADIVALSALLTTTMISMDDTVRAFVQSGLRDKVKIIIGGAPVTQEYADEISADGYAEDAQAAVELAARLLEGNTK
jgi:5-methyltetrahydrofolate--homocysteine methyltransferase